MRPLNLFSPGTEIWHKARRRWMYCCCARQIELALLLTRPTIPAAALTPLGSTSTLNVCRRCG